VSKSDWTPRPAEPYEPGNTAALKHGADSSRRWKPIADRLAAEVVTIAPWLGRPAFAAAVKSWARLEAQVTLITTWLDEHGLTDEDGEPRRAATYAAKLETQAQNARGRLGLDPASLISLLQGAQAVAGELEEAEASLVGLTSEGRKALEARSE